MGEVIDLKTRKPVLPPPRSSRDAIDDLYAGVRQDERLIEELRHATPARL